MKVEKHTIRCKDGKPKTLSPYSIIVNVYSEEEIRELDPAANDITPSAERRQRIYKDVIDHTSEHIRRREMELARSRIAMEEGVVCSK
jgi:hypothetical protein